MLENVTDTALAHHAGFAFATVYAIQYLKNAKWFPWMWTNTDTVNRVVSAVTALVTAAGVKFTAEAAAPGVGATVITITLPSLMTMLYGVAIHFSTQFGMQEMIYRSTVKRPAEKRHRKPAALRAAA